MQPRFGFSLAMRLAVSDTDPDEADQEKLKPVNAKKSRCDKWFVFLEDMMAHDYTVLPECNYDIK